ncbi:hypothetical protein PG985_014669 [Apiospora marii]|uniref:uncharacterized protein n=1 Tax=Apiospora marii TaxID=335849 RepID=UPI003130C014
MKVVIVGGSGLVATELISQSMAMAEITSVVAVARKPIELGADTVDHAKFKSMVIDDYERFGDPVRKELAGADVCIWTVAITPGRLYQFDFAEVKRVCQDCTMAGLKAVSEANTDSAKTTTFVYMSAEGTPEDLTKKPFFMGDYLLMRGETERLVKVFGQDNDRIDVHIVRPGMVWSSITFWRSMVAKLFRATNLLTSSIPNIGRTELAAAILDQAVRGFEKDDLSNADLVHIGEAALASRAEQ